MPVFCWHISQFFDGREQRRFARGTVTIERMETHTNEENQQHQHAIRATDINKYRVCA